MNIWIDRSVCNLWEPACEADFNEKFLGDQVLPTACLLKVTEEEDRSRIVFYIHDRDGTDKVFVVTDENIMDAAESWINAYWEQADQETLIQVRD